MKVGASKNLIPAAIILAGLVLSLTIYAVRHETVPRNTSDLSRMLPITSEDHRIGNPDARVTIVTYTDFSCEYCTRFQEVMERIVDEAGAKGDVAWVVRHFPIVDVYPHSGTHAEAAECAARLGGEHMFWEFIAALHARAVPGESVDPKDYASLATALGLPGDTLSICAESPEFDGRISRDFQNGLLIGAKGAPFSVVVIDGVESYSVSGFVPYDGIQAILTAAREESR